MKLIKEIEKKRDIHGRIWRYGLFYCEYCNKKVEKPFIHNKLCTRKELAMIYHVSKSQIDKIISNKSWIEEVIYNGV